MIGVVPFSRVTVKPMSKGRADGGQPLADQIRSDQIRSVLANARVGPACTRLGDGWWVHDPVLAV